MESVPRGFIVGRRALRGGLRGTKSSSLRFPKLPSGKASGHASDARLGTPRLRMGGCGPSRRCATRLSSRLLTMGRMRRVEAAEAGGRSEDEHRSARTGVPQDDRNYAEAICGRGADEAIEIAIAKRRQCDNGTLRCGIWVIEQALRAGSEPTGNDSASVWARRRRDADS